MRPSGWALWFRYWLGFQSQRPSLLVTLLLKSGSSSELLETWGCDVCAQKGSFQSLPWTQPRVDCYCCHPHCFISWTWIILHRVILKLLSFSLLLLFPYTPFTPHILYRFLLCCLFIWLCWVFVAAHMIFIVSCKIFHYIIWTLQLWHEGAGARVCNSYGVQALVALRHVES